jgi:hypothetical protein
VALGKEGNGEKKTLLQRYLRVHQIQKGGMKEVESQKFAILSFKAAGIVTAFGFNA